MGNPPGKTETNAGDETGERHSNEPDFLADGRLNVLFGVGSAVLGALALALGWIFAGHTLQSGLRAMALSAGSIALIGAVARFIAHFFVSAWAKQLDGAGKLLGMLAALATVILALYSLRLPTS